MRMNKNTDVRFFLLLKIRNLFILPQVKIIKQLKAISRHTHQSGQRVKWYLQMYVYQVPY